MPTVSGVSSASEARLSWDVDMASLIAIDVVQAMRAARSLGFVHSALVVGASRRRIIKIVAGLRTAELRW